MTRSARDDVKPLDPAVDWDPSEALTRVILQKHDTPLPSAAPVATRISLPSLSPPVAVPTPPLGARPASLIAARPGVQPGSPPPPRAVPPPPSIAAAPPLVPPAASPAEASRSQVRLAIYGLLLLLTVGAVAKLLLGARAPGTKTRANATPSGAASASVSTSGAAAKRPIVEVRKVEAPTVKDAVSALSRGDYKEALAQYRALAQREPGQQAYQSLVRILERRLAPKQSSP